MESPYSLNPYRASERFKLRKMRLTKIDNSLWGVVLRVNITDSIQVKNRRIIIRSNAALPKISFRTAHKEHPHTEAISASGLGNGVEMSCSRSPAGKPVARAPHRSMVKTHQLYDQHERLLLLLEGRYKTLTKYVYAQLARWYPREEAISRPCYVEIRSLVVVVEMYRI